MKKMKSLVAAFTLATAGMLTMGAAPANARTVPVNGGQVWNEQMPQASAYVSQAAIDNLAYNVGVQTAYYRDGRGFTQGTADTGENIGLEFRLNGNNATVVRAYNLDDPSSRAQFQADINGAYANDRALAEREYAGAYSYYEPQTYVICPSPIAVIGIGWGVRGWFPGYSPVYTPWFGFWEGGHRIRHEEIIIERGREHNPWIGGYGNNYHHDHRDFDRDNRNFYNEEHRGQDVRREAPVVRQPFNDNRGGRERVETRPMERVPQQHIEQRREMPQQHFEQRMAQPRFEQQRSEPRNDAPRGNFHPGAPGGHHH